MSTSEHEFRLTSGTATAHAEWIALAGATERTEACRAWLSLQARHIEQQGERVTAGIVLLRPSETDSYKPAAVWPNARIDVTHLSDAAERALRERQGMVLPAAKGSMASHIAYPLEVSGRLHGVVALEVATTLDETLQRVQRTLYWGAGRLESMLAQDDTASALRIMDGLALNLDVVAVVSEHDAFEASARALVTELASRAKCDRVAIGFREGFQCKLTAVSHSAEFEERANVVRALEAAMDEAIDQQSCIVVPERNDKSVLISRATEELRVMAGGGSVFIAPLFHAQETVGALVFESSPDDLFDAQTIRLMEAVAALVGPIVQLQRRNARSIARRLRDAAVDGFARFFGRGHLTWKVVGIFLVTLLCVLALGKGDYRVTADAALEGQVVRAAVAPFDSYIASADVKAGDIVSFGDPIVTFDDRDLVVERQRISSRLEQVKAELREAEANREWARAGILNAQESQAAAELALIDDQLSRTRLTAPFDGVVVSGDLSQSLGAPVQRGEVLFEIAPLDEYRVILEVDERDIDEIVVGQTAELALSSMPGNELQLVVESVTPVTLATDGRNVFRVEASVPEGGERLRPGMEGVAKIAVDERSLWWIWTHRIEDWLRLWVWTWWP